MKLKRIFLALTLLIGFGAFAQETDEERECLRMRFLAGEELKINNFAGASVYYLKGEKICGGYDKANYDRLIGTLRNTITEEKDDVKKKAYTDTLMAVYERAEKAGHVGIETYLLRAQYELTSTKPNYKAADEFFVKGMRNAGLKLDEAYVGMYDYNLLLLLNSAEAKDKPALKKRYITEYFTLSKLVADAKMSATAQETLNTYLSYVVKTCDDILPELKGFMAALPQEKEAKKATVKNFLTLLEAKSCEGSKEYEMLIDTMITIDPGFETMILKARLLVGKKRYNEAMSAYRDAKPYAPDAAAGEDIEYEILKMQFSQGNYKTAYNSAMGISGKNRSEALKMAGQCVAQMANSCGTSTVERKFNYYYASDLYERAGISGKYSSNFPTSSELFDNGFTKGQSVNLSCWGVNVTIR
jgi:hypothetical protein|tara:strand:+ start:3267 stop:4511 length:1245 start_codon:yes stop_codon:yes gene_type:complete